MTELIMNSDSIFLGGDRFAYGDSCSIAGPERLPTLEDWLYPHHFKHDGWPKTTVPASDTVCYETLGDFEAFGSQLSQPRWIPEVAPEYSSDRRVRSEVKNRRRRHPETGGTPNSKPLCYLCGEAFSASKSLKRHMDTVHRDERISGQTTTVYTCNVCRRDYSRRDVFLRHEKYQHQGRRVNCSVCGKSIAERALRGHNRSQACAAMRAIKAVLERKPFESLKLAAATFSLDSTVDPLFACVQLLFCYSYIVEKDVPRLLSPRVLEKESTKQKTDRLAVACWKFWRLRDFAVRTILRALRCQIQAASSAFAGALFIMTVLDANLSLFENVNLYDRILRSHWTLQRHRMDFGNFLRIMESAFATSEATSTSDETPGASQKRAAAFAANAAIAVTELRAFHLTLIERLFDAGCDSPTVYRGLMAQVACRT